MQGYRRTEEYDEIDVRKKSCFYFRKMKVERYNCCLLRHMAEEREGLQKYKKTELENIFGHISTRKN